MGGHQRAGRLVVVGTPRPQLRRVVGGADLVADVGAGQTGRVAHPRRGLRVAGVERGLQCVVGEVEGAIEVSCVHFHLGELTESIRSLELNPPATERVPHRLESLLGLGELARPQALPSAEDRWPATEERSFVDGGEREGTLDQSRTGPAGHQRHGRQRCRRRASRAPGHGAPRRSTRASLLSSAPRSSWPRYIPSSHPSRSRTRPRKTMSSPDSPRARRRNSSPRSMSR